MTARDVLLASGGAIRRAPLRSGLTLLAMGIGVAAVVVLTALGEGARRYVAGEFSALGTNLLIVLPGRSETVGGPPPLLGETPRDLTLDDALSLAALRNVTDVAPLTIGVAPVTFGGRERESPIVGTTAAFRRVRRLELAGGRFLPDTDPRRPAAACVIGPTVRRELFGGGPALGQWLRVADRRFQVVGVLASRGQSLGFDLDNIVIVPVASAQALFDTPSLFRVIVDVRGRDAVARARDDVRATIERRHDGEDDVTIITQDALLSTFDRIFTALTLTLAGIAAISLGVAGVLVMNVMLVAVTERTSEIGLLKALGGSRRDIEILFLAESAALSLAGGIAGLLAGWFGSFVVGQLYPALPARAPGWAVAAALGTALATGLVFGIAPARRAARLDPVLALGRH